MWTVVSICGEWSAILSDSLVMLTYLYTCREAGIACTKSSGSTNALDTHRTELLSLLIVCFSESLYYSQEEEKSDNQWLAHFTSIGNRHILPLLTSLLNVVFSYDPVGYGVPYAYAFYSDARENLVTAALQLLVIVLDYKPEPSVDQAEQQSRPVIWTNSLLQVSSAHTLYLYVAQTILLHVPELSSHSICSLYVHYI